jgi:hypothetical protein
MISGWKLNKEKLISADVWGTELKKRLRKVQVKVQPSFIMIYNQMVREEGVDEDVIEESMTENDWKQAMSII